MVEIIRGKYFSQKLEEAKNYSEATGRLAPTNTEDDALHWVRTMNAYAKENGITWEPTKERIRAFEKPGLKGVDFHDGRKVRLMRDSKYLYIDGVRCELERYSAREMAAAKSASDNILEFKECDYENEIEQIATLLNGIIMSLEDNIFATPEDRAYIRSVVNEYMKSVAQTRADISKLLYE